MSGVLRPGDPAPDVDLLSLDGNSVPLRRAWSRGQAALLVFLRHLG